MWYEVPAFRWLLLVILFTVLFAFAGCASFEGVKMDEEEAKACKTQGCTVWTDAELEQLVRAAKMEGARRGRSRL